MKYVKVVVILAVLVFAYLFLRSTDWATVGASLQKIGFNFFWLILTTAASYFCGTLAWRCCIGREGKHINLGRLFLVRVIGETVGAINPTSIVGGEATKIYLLRHQQVKKSTLITSVLLSRILMITTQVFCWLIIAIYMMVGKNAVKLNFGVKNGVIFCLVIGIALVVALIRFRRFLKALLLKTRTGHWLKHRTVKLRQKIDEAGHALTAFYHTNKKALLLSILFFILHWMTGSFELYLILKMLGTRVAYIPAMFVDMSVIIFKSAGAFIPGQIGIEEYGNKVMLAAIGITVMETWVTASVLRRARQLFWIVFGLITYFFVDKKKKHIAQQQNGNTVCEP